MRRSSLRVRSAARTQSTFGSKTATTTMPLRDGCLLKCCLSRRSNVAVAANVAALTEEENTLENGEEDEEEECFAGGDNGNGVAERPLQ